MGTWFLIDTNVLIDVQTRKLQESALTYLAGIINADFTVSFISYIEFLGYKFATIEMQQFISLATVIEINRPIIDAAIGLRRKNPIQLPDAIIAATALVTNRTLLTRNVADFKNIEELMVINPWDK
jgi:predicted nucleic acid-binding protein